MTLDGHFMNVLGKYLRELAPLITEAVHTLDRPGSRALRRKLDGAFHSAVIAYNAASSSGLSERDWPKADYIDHDRIIPHRSGWRHRKAAADADEGGSARAAWYERAGLRLVVDNAIPARNGADRPARLTVVQGSGKRLSRPVGDIGGGDHAA